MRVRVRGRLRVVGSKMADIFISYAGADTEAAEEIGRELRKRRIKYFLAPKSVSGGEEFDEAIQNALRACKEVFLLLTPESLRSDWVKYEYIGALILAKHIVPILLRCTNEQLPRLLWNKQTRDFSQTRLVIEEFQARERERKSRKDDPYEVTPLQLISKNAPKHEIRYRGVLKESLDTSAAAIPPFEFVENYGYNPKVNLYPKAYRGKIQVDTVHAGDWIPAEFYWTLARHSNPENRLLDLLNDNYVREKDWGANHVALALAQGLNLKGFHRVNVARVLLDFGRLPGVTPPGTGHLNRLSINYPFSHYLNYEEKRRLLHEYYDRISAEMEKAVVDKLIKISIHTYDKYDSPHKDVEVGALRPAVSLIYSPLHHPEQKNLAGGFFDSLYPDELADFTADRRLTARISLNLERVGIPVAHNNPYVLPQGSVEVRSQVWFFFKYLKAEFEKENHETVWKSEYRRVWNMLLDTSLRSSESETLRSYIHTFRLAPSATEHELDASRRAYEEIKRFFSSEKKEEILRGYRYAPERPSSLAIEIRKDYLWSFHDTKATRPVEGPEGVKTANVHIVASLIADAIRTYLMKDINVTDVPHPDIA